MNNNAFENDIYQLLKTSESSDPNKIDKIIRHYKVIIRNNYNNEVSVVKYIKDNNGKVIKYNKDIYPDITENDIIAYKYTLHDAISQDTDNYLNENIYSYNSIELDNFYKDKEYLIEDCNNEVHSEGKPKVLQGKHYNSINEIKDDINALKNIVSQNYINHIINGNIIKDGSLIESDEESFEETINELINNLENIDSLYIRLGADKSEQRNLIERILSYNQNGLYDVELALDDGLPIFNDNKAYSNKKYKILKNTFEI